MVLFRCTLDQLHLELFWLLPESGEVLCRQLQRAHMAPRHLSFAQSLGISYTMNLVGAAF
jgi:hypothetical protein